MICFGRRAILFQISSVTVSPAGRKWMINMAEVFLRQSVFDRLNVKWVKRKILDLVLIKQNKRVRYSKEAGIIVSAGEDIVHGFPIITIKIVLCLHKCFKLWKYFHIYYYI